MYLQDQEKKIRWYKQAKDQTEEEVQSYLNRMKNKLTKVRREGYRVIYIDETVFTRKTVKDREWCASRSNLAVDLV